MRGMFIQNIVCGVLDSTLLTALSACHSTAPEACSKDRKVISFMSMRFFLLVALSLSSLMLSAQDGSLRGMEGERSGRWLLDLGFSSVGLNAYSTVAPGGPVQLQPQAPRIGAGAQTTLGYFFDKANYVGVRYSALPSTVTLGSTSMAGTSLLTSVGLELGHEHALSNGLYSRLSVGLGYGRYDLSLASVASDKQGRAFAHGLSGDFSLKVGYYIAPKLSVGISAGLETVHASKWQGDAVDSKLIAPFYTKGSLLGGSAALYPQVGLYVSTRF